MKYRHIELLGLKTISADQTEPIEIDLVDPISRIIIDARAINGAGGDSTGHPLEGITKIELVDGSEVLHNLTGLCTQALDIYCSGEHPRGGWFNYLPTTETEIHVAMDFGRFLYDPILAFDPTKFRNPKLNITHDISAGGMAPSACKLAVYAEVFDEKAISPMGFLMTKEIKSWATVAAAHVYTNMPLDHTYRKLLIQGLKRGSPPHWVLGNIKLSEDQDKKVVLNDHFRDILFGMGRKNAFIRELLTSTGVAAKRTNYVTPTMDVMGAGNQWRNDTYGGAVGTYSGEGGSYEFWCEVAQNTVHHISGWAPHAVICIPFGDQQDIEDWYDISRIGNLKLDITDGVADGTTRVFIQQLRKY